MFYSYIVKDFCVYINLFTFKEVVVRVYKRVIKKNKIYFLFMFLGGMYVSSLLVLFKNNYCLII